MVEREFKEYNSIENSYREKFVNMIRLQAPELVHTQWSITEKIHGCNVQIALADNEISIGKRTDYVTDENFCNIQQILLPYENNVRKLKDSIEITMGKYVDRLIVFGELFGGTYLHKDVEKVKNAVKVQKGVQYCPQNDVIFFDIFCEYKDGTSGYLAPSIFEKFMESVKLPFQHCIIVNSLNEALEYPNDEPSQIYTRYNLPQLDDNIREGVVIKPYRCDKFINHSRVVLKNKNERFAEVSRAKKKQEPSVRSLPENLQTIVDDMTAYVNENRLNNIVSHLGEVSPKDMGMIIGLLNKDVIEDFNKDTGALNILEKADVKVVTKAINNVVSKFIRTNLLPKL